MSPFPTWFRMTLLVLVALPVLWGLWRSTPEWPRPPKWMRITAAVAGLALIGVGVVVLVNARDASLGLFGLAIAAAAGFGGLRLLVWAAIGRVRPPRGRLAAPRDAPPKPRPRSR